MIPNNRPPTHPGEVILEEYLKPANLSQVKAAKLLGIPMNRLNEIVRGKRGVTANTALRLASVFETSPQFWMNLQSAWDLHRAVPEIDRQLRQRLQKPLKGRPSVETVR